jgi:hypothetical protein
MVPSENEVAIAKTRWNDVVLDSLKKGYSLYTGKCGRCHELYKPGDYTEDEWEDILPKMSRKAKITKGEEELIRRFVITRSIFTISKRKQSQ